VTPIKKPSKILIILCCHFARGFAELLVEEVPSLLEPLQRLRRRSTNVLTFRGFFQLRAAIAVVSLGE